MEVLPHFWITYYNNNLFIIKKKELTILFIYLKMNLL